MPHSQFLIDIGNRIAQKRTAKGWTQQDLADRVEVSLQTISNVECGRKGMRVENIAKICIALEASADYILLGKRAETQMKGLVKKISELSEEQYKAVENLINMLQNQKS